MSSSAKDEKSFALLKTTSVFQAVVRGSMRVQQSGSVSEVDGVRKDPRCRRPGNCKLRVSSYRPEGTKDPCSKFEVVNPIAQSGDDACDLATRHIWEIRFELVFILEHQRVRKCDRRSFDFDEDFTRPRNRVIKFDY
jgi:hypothetical protein